MVRFCTAFTIYILRRISVVEPDLRGEEVLVLVGFSPPVPAVVLWPCAHLTVAAKLGNPLELPHCSSVSEALVSFDSVHIVSSSSKTNTHQLFPQLQNTR